ncbi:MAG: outer spore coat protein CotE [Bacilli bacterium]|nr:outer spore coat protein CotE [Bacilli bacterium]
MAAYKEIVTKAVIGKGKKHFKNTYTVKSDNKPTTVLGCWIINHKFNGYKKDKQIGVDGSFDINIWYSYDDDTKTTVINKTINYDDLFNVRIKDEADLSLDTDIIVRSLKQPMCQDVDIIDGDTISFTIEKELGVEVVGETKMKIAVEEDEEPWEELTDEADDDTLDDIDKEVDENYMESTNK